MMTHVIARPRSQSMRRSRELLPPTYCQSRSMASSRRARGVPAQMSSRAIQPHHADFATDAEARSPSVSARYSCSEEAFSGTFQNARPAGKSYMAEFTHSKDGPSLDKVV